ncbi:MAG: hypothetical protein ABIH25_00165 [Candidatus Woesearchaeota archaeon]
MKKWVKIFLVILLFPIFVYVVVVEVIMIKEAVGCSRWNPENCDYSCSVNSDCKLVSCGTCVNIGESYSTGRTTIFGKMFVSGQCIPGTCECVNNKCEYVLG